MARYFQKNSAEVSLINVQTFAKFYKKIRKIIEVLHAEFEDRISGEGIIFKIDESKFAK